LRVCGNIREKQWASARLTCSDVEKGLARSETAHCKRRAALTLGLPGGGSLLIYRPFPCAALEFWRHLSAFFRLGRRTHPINQLKLQFGCCGGRKKSERRGLHLRPRHRFLHHLAPQPPSGPYILLSQIFTSHVRHVGDKKIM
jgi:hypothetical protein